MGSGYTDEEYVRNGAKIVETAEDVYGGAEMVVKVKEPLPAEYRLLRKGQILFTYLHLAASQDSHRSAAEIRASRASPTRRSR